MSGDLHIGVMGAGSIGCYVGGKLMASGPGRSESRVTLVGRARLLEELEKHPLELKDVSHKTTRVQAKVQLNPEALSSCDVVLCAVKSPQTLEVAKTLDKICAPETVVVSLQNGLSNPQVLREQLKTKTSKRTVLAGIVGFNVISQGAGRFHRTTDGPLTLERNDSPKAKALYLALKDAGFAVELRDDIIPDQWTKLLVNLNNAISALSGAPTKTMLLSPAYRRIVSAVVEEALSILKAADIKPAKLRGVPVGLMPKVLRLPTAIVRLVTSAQLRIDPEARSSMWEDLTRGRPTEVDHLNGELVRLAEAQGLDAPLNRRIVQLIHEAEHVKEGCPGLKADVLWASLKNE